MLVLVLLSLGAVCVLHTAACQQWDLPRNTDGRPKRHQRRRRRLAKHRRQADAPADEARKDPARAASNYAERLQPTASAPLLLCQQKPTRQAQPCLGPCRKHGPHAPSGADAEQTEKSYARCPQVGQPPVGTRRVERRPPLPIKLQPERCQLWSTKQVPPAALRWASCWCNHRVEGGNCRCQPRRDEAKERGNHRCRPRRAPAVASAPPAVINETPCTLPSSGPAAGERKENRAAATAAQTKAQGAV